MNRSLLNLLIDLVAAVCLLIMIATGYVLRFPLPPTTNRTHELWGLSRHEWGIMHSWASLGLLAVLFVHVALHWEWIFAMVRRRFTRATQAGPTRPVRAEIITMTTLLALVGMFAWAAHLGVREREVPLHPLSEPKEAPANIPSAMTNAPAPRRVEFWRDVMPVFEASCIGCHGPKLQRANFRVDRPADFFVPRGGQPLVVPGDADASRLPAIVSGEVQDMKDAEAHRLPPDEIAMLKAWIQAGANWLQK